MSEIVVRDVQGRFMAVACKWHTDYPEARIFGKPGAAVAAARASGELCEVIEDYGLATERVIDVVQGK